jgi:hypothetical protein
LKPIYGLICSAKHDEFDSSAVGNGINQVPHRAPLFQETDSAGTDSSSSPLLIDVPKAHQVQFLTILRSGIFFMSPCPSDRFYTEIKAPD